MEVRYTIYTRFGVREASLQVCVYMSWNDWGAVKWHIYMSLHDVNYPLWQFCVCAVVMWKFFGKMGMTFTLPEYRHLPFSSRFLDYCFYFAPVIWLHFTDMYYMLSHGHEGDKLAKHLRPMWHSVPLGRPHTGPECFLWYNSCVHAVVVMQKAKRISSTIEHHCLAAQNIELVLNFASYCNNTLL